MTSYTLYRCPVDGQLYAEVPGLAVHPGLAAVRYYATSPHSPEAKRHRFWARVLRAMERQAAQVQASRGQVALQAWWPCRPSPPCRLWELLPPIRLKGTPSHDSPARAGVGGTLRFYGRWVRSW